MEDDNTPGLATSETFKNSNVFIVKRNHDPDGFKLSIQTEETAKSQNQLEHLQTSIFYDLIFNVDGMASSRQHETILGFVTPSLASQLYFENNVKAEQMIEIFLSDAPSSKKEYLGSLPDSISSLEFVLKENFLKFQVLLKSDGLTKALQEMNPFFSQMQSLFFDLPACFSSVVANYWNHESK